MLPTFTTAPQGGGYTNAGGVTLRSCGQHGNQMLQLLVHFARRRYGLGDFCAQEFTVTAAEAMHCDLDRPFGQPQLWGHFGVSERGLLTPDECLESLKNWQSICGRIALAQTGERGFD